MSAPSMASVPALGASRPAIRRSSVVLPQPLGPSSEKISPGAIASVTSSTAVTSPKLLRRPAISRLAWELVTARDYPRCHTAAPARPGPPVAPGRLPRYTGGKDSRQQGGGLLRKGSLLPVRGGTRGCRWTRRIAALMGLALAWAPAAAQADALDNAILLENQKTGSAAEEWDVRGRSDPALQGFATRMSVNLGETVFFKVRSLVPSYRLDVYRVGYYQGSGARRVASLAPADPRQAQPECAQAPVDCSAWAVSAAWTVPADAVSGVYLAKLVRTDGVRSSGSHIVFVVRDDLGGSALLVQTSDTTWQAYNNFGGPSNSSLYNGAVRVSYDRPLIGREVSPDASLFGPEISLVRFLERNGYDVSYTSGVDTAMRGGLLLRHQVFVSADHDACWPAETNTWWRSSRPPRIERRGGARRGRPPRLPERQRDVLEDALGGGL